MAWRRIGDKPLSEPMLTKFADAYMRHYGRISKWFQHTNVTLVCESNAFPDQFINEKWINNHTLFNNYKIKDAVANKVDSPLRGHDVKLTSSWRQNDVATSFNVMMTLFLRLVSDGDPRQQAYHTAYRAKAIRARLRIRCTWRLSVI